MNTLDKPIKLNIGSGRKLFTGFTNIDIIQFVDGNGKEIVDVVMDIEKDKLPYEDDSVEFILIDNVLEHVENLRFVLNECHRVLKEDGILQGMVPVAGTEYDFRDPTHKRHFIKSTFSYFTGINPAMPSRPSHPKYADYGFLPWYEIELKQEDLLIHFKLSPRKNETYKEVEKVVDEPKS